MKHGASGGKANRQLKRHLQDDSSSAGKAAAMAPPDYGIDFVDRALASGAPSAAVPVQRRPAVPAPNQTGMPDHLKAGIEALSGMDLSDVKVHANSSKPAQLNALAYTEGSDIHVAPGQEKHLPHEAWHVVQQRQGRVKPTLQMKGKPINDSVELEREADAMGDRALRLSSSDAGAPVSKIFQTGTIPHAHGCGCAACAHNSGSDSRATMQAKAGGRGVIQRVPCSLCGVEGHDALTCPRYGGENKNAEVKAPAGKKRHNTPHHQNPRADHLAAKRRRNG